MSKLTLHVEESLIAVAKAEAAARQVSVSKLVSDFFRVLSAKQTCSEKMSLPSITQSLLGCIEDTNVGMDSYVDYLEKKHS